MIPTISALTPVRQFPYRTARPQACFLELPRKTLEVLEDALAAASGENKDNHTLYEITYQGVKTYIFFSDFNATLGHSIEERPW